MPQRLLNLILSLILLAGLRLSAKAQAAPKAEPAAEEAAEPSGQAADEEAAPEPKKKAGHARPAKADKPDPMKGRLMDIAKVYKNQMAWGAEQFEVWKTFWTKARDERGRFEVRLSKQREDFIESLRSLETKDHGQSLADFETMQGNVMRSFEENQASKIKEYIADLQGKLREFGATQEAERAKLADSSEEAWQGLKSSLDIQAPPPLKESKKDKKDKKKKDKKKD